MKKSRLEEARIEASREEAVAGGREIDSSSLTAVGIAAATGRLAAGRGKGHGRIGSGWSVKLNEGG
jgi:hypothetical protein